MDSFSNGNTSQYFGDYQIKKENIWEIIRKKNGVENIGGIVDAICGKDSGKMQLFIDMQGGSRTDGYVRNAVLSILNNELNGQVKIRKIVATDFNPRNFANGIVDETKRYQITDLVSGMNAFIQYGKANLIQEYWENMEIMRSVVFSVFWKMGSREIMQVFLTGKAEQSIYLNW